MNQEFELALQALADEKGLTRDEIIRMIEASLAAAFRKDYGEKDQNIAATFNPEDLSARMYEVKTVVENVEEPVREIALEEAVQFKPDALLGDEIRTEITPTDGVAFGRIAAQTAKQVIIQKIREAERSAQYSDFKAKERSLVNAVVHRIDGNAIVMDLGKGNGLLFPSEQIRGEKCEIGQRMKVLILHVESGIKGPKITVSRSHPDMVRKLFELEVPEINNGTVEIKAIAREAGSRSKIAVSTDQEGVDPIGACVGQKGTRVQTVIVELGGEKVDIVEWSEDPVKFIANALSPAKIINVKLNFDEKQATVGVLEDQLSLAIGKAGQNVRLAARLTGWKIDINPEKLDTAVAPIETAAVVAETDSEVESEA